MKNHYYFINLMKSTENFIQEKNRCERKRLNCDRVISLAFSKKVNHSNWMKIFQQNATQPPGFHNLSLNQILKRDITKNSNWESIISPKKKLLIFWVWSEAFDFITNFSSQNFIIKFKLPENIRKMGGLPFEQKDNDNSKGTCVIGYSNSNNLKTNHIEMISKSLLKCCRTQM